MPALSRDRSPRLSTLILASSVGTYLLILSGVSNALAGTTGACGGWPLCETAWLGSPAVTLVMAHRMAAVVVGVVLVLTLVAAFVRDISLRTRVALVTAGVLFPFEVLVGARVATSGGTTPIATLHLVTAMLVFSALMAGFIWQFQTEPSTTTATKETGRRTESKAGDRPVTATDSGLIDVLFAYVRLTKPALWWLLGFVALASMGLAADGVPPLDLTVATIAGGVLAIGASGTFNNVLERDRDQRMARTADRPVATSEIPPRRAVAFGFGLFAASIGLFLAFVNVLAAGLAALAVVFYSVVYTVILKPRTHWNTVLGGAVGALPALIGWAAVRETVGLPAVVLGAVVFLWTPAHFYNLALVYKEDYARAGFPMLPVVHGDRTTRRHVAGFLTATLLATVVLGSLPTLGAIFAGAAVLLGTAFLVSVQNLERRRTDRAAMRTFLAANVYLGGLLLAIMVETMLV
jgi:protoheme IX farnesyltransferase